MITKDKIEEAVNEFIGHAPDIDESVKTLRCREGFRGGVEWFKKAIWHDVSELPERYDSYLVETKDCVFICFFLGKWQDERKILRWCDIEDLL